MPAKLRRLLAEDREPRSDAAGGVVDDAVLAAAHARGRVVPEALGEFVDEALCLLGAQRTDVGERHDDAVAAVVAEVVLEVQLARHEVVRAPCPAVELRAPAGGGVELCRRSTGILCVARDHHVCGQS